MANANDKTILLEIAYGSEDAVDRDVDLFEEFYAGHFKEEALSRFVARARSRNRTLFVALCLAGALLVLPMAINPSSVFAAILLAMGVMLMVVGLYFAYRMATAERFCSENFGRLIDDEFAASRSVTKRVFAIRLSELGVTVNFGSQTAVKQTRRKGYEEIPGVHLTDDLVFIEGLTWVARFQTSDEEFSALCSLLKQRCAERFYDWRIALSGS
ncbi:hypothetical protein [Raoultibacter massiliensis]|uniref:YcxB-like protein domain-containing protein n=1 Tax=Raoultibacter massiliensis TaxID=1852371 RepID=A0ABV1JD06_9ACTN